LLYIDSVSCFFAECVYEMQLLFFIEFLGFFRHNIISSANRDNLTSSFPTRIPLISFSWLIVLARISSAILNKSGVSGNPCLFPDFRGNGFFFPHLV
jgi:hypothetical protein